MGSLLTSPIEERPKLAFHIAKKEMKIIIFWFYILQIIKHNIEKEISFFQRFLCKDLLKR
jgi:hypothetical protein